MYSSNYQRSRQTQSGMLEEKTQQDAEEDEATLR